MLVRELASDEPEARDGATHAALSLFRVDRDPRIPPGTWHYASGDICIPRLAESNEGERAEVRLADIPTPGDTSLQLLVRERNCASGQSAEGRVRVDELTLTDTEVRLRVSVVPPDGDQNCPDNPWTQLEVDLGEPLGERTVVDANLVVDETGTVRRVAFDPSSADDDEVAYRVFADVDSPGDPIDQNR